MTRKQLQIAYDDTLAQYESLLSMVVAIVRQQGPIRVERALVADQDGKWTIATEPSGDGSAATVRVIHNGAEVSLQ